MTTKTKNPLSDPKLYEKLTAPFPAEALRKVQKSKKPGGFALTSIQAQFIKERLNEVFGPFGWGLVGDSKDISGGVLFTGELQIYDRTDGEARLYHRVEGEGFHPKKDSYGDTVKSARTDCLSKTASSLGIGNEVFKGEINPHELDRMLEDERNEDEIKSLKKFVSGRSIEEQEKTFKWLKIVGINDINSDHIKPLRELRTTVSAREVTEEVKNAKSE